MSHTGSYTIKQGDTLEGIAQRVLGDRSRWRELVVLNRLRYPFISDNIHDQLGQPLLATELAAAYTAGLTLSVDSYDPAAFVYGNFVLLEATGGQLGHAIYDLTTITGTATPVNGLMTYSSELQALLSPAQLTALGQGNLLQLAGQPTHAYGVGAPVSIFTDPSLQHSFVLGTGMTLRVPADEDLSNVLVISDSEYKSLLGTDLALDTRGMLSARSRDLDTVSGTTNLAQALRIRATTELGELVRHPDYGNGLLAYIGSTSPHIAIYAYSELARCFLGDPRVNRVASMTAAQVGDVIKVNATLELRGRAGLLTLSDLVITSGG